VRASQDLKTVTPVREEGGLCAELLASSREQRMKDWIDGGSYPLYSPMVGSSAQSGVSIRPSDRC